MKNINAIEVKNVVKSFKLYSDKPNTLKERLVRFGKNKIESRVVLDNNTIPDSEFDIVPSTKIPPEDIIHLWYRGQPSGFIYKPSDDSTNSDVTIVPEDGVIHFSLGGLLGDYTFDVVEKSGDIKTYDIHYCY